MATYIVKHGQSIYDIATQIYGSVLGVVHILRDNVSIDLTTYLPTGREITVNPTSDTIFDQNIVNFFASRTITNSETLQNVISLSSGVVYGEIFTSNPAQESYINSTMRSVQRQLNLSDRGENPLDSRNRDRVIFNDHFSLNNDGDELEIVLSYDDHILGTGGKWYPMADSTSDNAGSYMYFDDSNGQLYIRTDSQLLWMTNPVSTNPNTDINIKIRCEVIVTNTVTKNYFVDVNGTESSSLDVGGENMMFDTIGGYLRNGVGVGDGFNGSIKYLRYNDSEYDFNEKSGIYTFKTIR